MESRKQVLTEKYVLVNERVLMIDGMIDNNPFYKETRHTKAGMWVISNKEMVVSKIKKELRHPKTPPLGYGKSVTDVYMYIVTYYLENTHKDYQRNYKGKDSDYTIAAYILSSVRNLIYNFVNQDDMSISKFGVVNTIIADNDPSENKQYTVRESFIQSNDNFQDNIEIIDSKYIGESFAYMVILLWDILTIKDKYVRYTPSLIFQYLFWQDMPPIVENSGSCGLDDKILKPDEIINAHSKSERYVKKDRERLRRIFVDDNEYTEDLRQLYQVIKEAVEKGYYTLMQVQEGINMYEESEGVYEVDAIRKDREELSINKKG